MSHFIVDLLAREPGAPGPKVKRFLVAAFLVDIASELVFTLYVSAQGYQNLIGHHLSVVCFYLACQALFATQVRGRTTLIAELSEGIAELHRRATEREAVRISCGVRPDAVVHNDEDEVQVPRGLDGAFPCHGSLLPESPAIGRPDGLEPPSLQLRGPGCPGDPYAGGRCRPNPPDGAVRRIDGSESSLPEKAPARNGDGVAVGVWLRRKVAGEDRSAIEQKRDAVV